VLGLDLTRARGVVVRGLGESFARPRSLPTMMTHSRVTYLLGGIAARPPPPPSFGSSSSARLLAHRRVLLGLMSGAKEVCWRGHGRGRSGATEDKASLL
jgi:hypothetical protein